MVVPRAWEGLRSEFVKGLGRGPTISPIRSEVGGLPAAGSQLLVDLVQELLLGAPAFLSLQVGLNLEGGSINCIRYT